MNKAQTYMYTMILCTVYAAIVVTNQDLVLKISVSYKSGL